MNYKVATCFSDDTWQAHGPSWLRHAKSAGLKGFLVGLGLSEDASRSVTEMGFEYIGLPAQPRMRADVFQSFAVKLEKGEFCLWTRPNAKPHAGLQTNMDVLVGTSKASVDDLCQSVINLYDRVAMAASIEDRVVHTYGGVLSTEYILGSREFWVGFSGCHSYLGSKEYIDQLLPCEDLVLNFFIAFANSFSIEVAPYKEG